MTASHVGDGHLSGRMPGYLHEACELLVCQSAWTAASLSSLTGLRFEGEFFAARK